MSAEDWDILADALSSGDAAAFTEAVERLLPAVASKFLSGDPLFREEILDAALVELLSRMMVIGECLEAFLAENPGAPSAGYLHQTLRNAVRQELRKKRHRRTPSTDGFDQGDTKSRRPEEIALTTDLLKKVRSALGVMPMRDRITIKLHLLTECPFDELGNNQLTPEERTWQPDRKRHPQSRPAGEAADAIVEMRTDAPAAEITADFIAERLGMSSRAAFDQWLHRARESLKAKVGG